jgi:hypothetical protein
VDRPLHGLHIFQRDEEDVALAKQMTGRRFIPIRDAAHQTNHLMACFAERSMGCPADRASGPDE